MIDAAPEIAPPAPTASRPPMTWPRCVLLVLLLPLIWPLLLIAAIRALLAPLPAPPEPAAPEAEPPQGREPLAPSTEPSCVPVASAEPFRRLLAATRPALAPVPPVLALAFVSAVLRVAIEGACALGWPSRFPGG